MEFDSFISTATGGALVLLLSQFVFTRLVHQVDRLADKIAKLEIAQAKHSEKIADFERLESDTNKHNARLVRLETMAKIGNH